MIGGFGYMPFGNPPGLVYEYDPGAGQVDEEEDPAAARAPSGAGRRQQQDLRARRLQAGASSATDAVNNVWEYDPATDNYRCDGADPRPRAAPRWPATVNGKIYLIGGIEPFENGKGSAHQRQEPGVRPATNTWTEAD